MSNTQKLETERQQCIYLDLERVFVNNMNTSLKTNYSFYIKKQCN